MDPRITMNNENRFVLADGCEVSPAGFGGYRIAGELPGHLDALQYALSRGCSLIDTASNYSNGRSEELIGRLSSSPEGSRAMVMTKGGYLYPSLLRQLSEDDAHIAADEAYSLDPMVLRGIIRTSLSRLRLHCLDVFLLHNPERLHEDRRVDVDDCLRTALVCLQEEVEAGRISYIGVSSNAFTRRDSHEGARISLPRLLHLVDELGAGDVFKVVEMPCNLLESDSSDICQLARAQGLVTVANRPLNACRNGTWLRLVDPPAEPLDVSVEHLGEQAAEFLSLVSRRLALCAPEYSPSSFPIVRFMKDAYLELKHADLIDQIFAQRVLPFLDTIYGGEMDATALRQSTAFFRACHDYAKHYAAAGEQLTGEGAVVRSAADSRRSLASRAAEYPLTRGFDHVLIGMRRREYVDDLASLFVRTGADAG